MCRANGLELCLYWNGRRTEEELVAQWNKSKFNYYRTDDYGAGPPFFVNDYRSFMDFNRKIDSLYRKHGIKFENCSNGGNIRTLDVSRRMTWMTHSDHSDLGPFFKNVYAWSYLMCPIQLRSDYNHLFEDVANLRGQLLGSIHWRRGATLELRAEGLRASNDDVDLTASGTYRSAESGPDKAQQSGMSFFVTSIGGGKGADFGGLAGADKHCQTLASPRPARGTRPGART